MKTLKTKLFMCVSMFVLALSMLVIGVWAVGETQYINLNGSVNFTIADDTLYIKDIRIRNANDLTGQGTSIENFLPGFVNGEVDLNLGTLSADTSFSLIFDIINTSTTAYQASSQSTISNAVLSVSGEIAGDGITPTEINESTPISGTIVMTITAQTAGNISLDGIVIDIEQIVGYDVTINVESFASSLPDDYDGYFLVNGSQKYSLTKVETFNLKNVSTIQFAVRGYYDSAIYYVAIECRINDEINGTRVAVSRSQYGVGGEEYGFSSVLSISEDTDIFVSVLVETRGSNN